MHCNFLAIVNFFPPDVFCLLLLFVKVIDSWRLLLIVVKLVCSPSSSNSFQLKHLSFQVDTVMLSETVWVLSLPFQRPALTSLSYCVGMVLQMLALSPASKVSLFGTSCSLTRSLIIYMKFQNVQKSSHMFDNYTLENFIYKLVQIYWS